MIGGRATSEVVVDADLASGDVDEDYNDAQGGVGEAAEGEWSLSS